VFVAYGGAERADMVEGGRTLGRAVAANRAFESRTRVFDDGEHLTYYAALVPAALSYLLPRKVRIERPDAVATTPETLTRYSGTYRFSDGRTLGVALVGGALQATRADRPALTLVASAPDRFFVPGLDLRLRFEGAAPAPATRVVLSINGDDATGERAPD
jgi:hypothetical protein